MAWIVGDERGRAVRSMALLALAAVAMSACHAPTLPTTPVQCPAWRNIDYSKLPLHINDDPLDPLYEDVWAEWADQDLSIDWITDHPTATVRIDADPGMMMPRIGRQVAARQSRSGWEVYARSTSLESAERFRWSDWRRVRLSGDGERRLSQLLLDPCLWLAPRFMESEVALRNGGRVAQYDAPSTSYDVTRGDQRWGGVHRSWAVGPQGRLRSLLLKEAFGLPEWFNEDIGPEGWDDWPD